MKLIHKNSFIIKPFSMRKYATSCSQWEEVQGYDFSSQNNYKVFLSTFNTNCIMGVYYVINDKLRATKELEIYSGEEWRTLDNLNIGDYLFNCHNKYERINKIDIIIEIAEAFQVESTANYFLNGYLVK